MSEVVIPQDVLNGESSSIPQPDDPFAEYSTDDSEDVEESGEDLEEDSSESSDDEESRPHRRSNVENRIAKLVGQRKAAENQVATLQQQMNDLMAYTRELQEQLKSPQKEPSMEPNSPASRDAETELIIRDLGGDEVAEKLFNVLNRHYTKSSTDRGILTKDEALNLFDERLNERFNMQQAGDGIAKHLASLQHKGALNEKEATWVANNLKAIISKNPGWLRSPTHAKMLVNHLVAEGRESGEITSMPSSVGGKTPISPGGNGRGSSGSSDLEIARTAASRFRTLRGKSDKELKRYSKGVRINSGSSINLLDEVE